MVDPKTELLLKKIGVDSFRMRRDIKRLVRKSARRPQVFLFLTIILVFGLFSSPRVVEAPKVKGQTSTLEKNLPAEDRALIRPILVPSLSPDTPAPAITAQGAAVYDLYSFTFLFEKDGDRRFLPASLTKVVTSLEVLKNCLPEDIVRVGWVETRGTQMGLQVGEEITVSNLLSGMFLNSGNDAAQALATACLGSDVQISLNREVELLGLGNSHFSNPTGLDEENHYSSAKDLAKISARLYQDPLIREIVKQKEANISSVDGRIWHGLRNSNRLIYEDPRVLGMKTGWTEAAGECLITVFAHGESQILIVVLKSEDRFQDTLKLMEWVSLGFGW